MELLEGERPSPLDTPSWGVAPPTAERGIRVDDQRGRRRKERNCPGQALGRRPRTESLFENRGKARPTVAETAICLSSPNSVHVLETDLEHGVRNRGKLKGPEDPLLGPAGTPRLGEKLAGGFGHLFALGFRKGQSVLGEVPVKAYPFEDGGRGKTRLLEIDKEPQFLDEVDDFPRCFEAFLHGGSPNYPIVQVGRY